MAFRYNGRTKTLAGLTVFASTRGSGGIGDIEISSAVDPTARPSSLSLKEAKAFVRSRGVVIPRYLFWFVPEDEGLTLEESGLADADATYYRIDQAPPNVGFPVYWNELYTNRSQITVFLRREVLRSDEHCLYVLADEIFEIRELKRVFLKKGEH